MITWHNAEALKLNIQRLNGDQFGIINYVEHGIKSTIKYLSSLLNILNNYFNKLFGSIGKLSNYFNKNKISIYNTLQFSCL
jgi:hypothetical protein